MGSIEWDELSHQIWAHYDKGEVDQAVEVATKRIELYPDEPSAYKTRAALNTKRDPSAAIADYTKALELASSDPRYQASLLVHRGKLYIVEGDLESAFSDFNHALQKDKNNFVAYRMRGVVYTRQGKHTLALDDLSTAIDFPDNDARTMDYYARASVYVDLDRPDLALQDYKKIEELAPQFPDIAELIKKYS